MQEWRLLAADNGKYFMQVVRYLQCTQLETQLLQLILSIRYLTHKNQIIIAQRNQPTFNPFIIHITKHLMHSSPSYPQCFHQHLNSSHQIDENLQLVELDSSKFKDSQFKMSQFMHTSLYRQAELAECPIHLKMMTILAKFNFDETIIVPENLLFCLPILIIIDDDAHPQLSEISNEIQSQFNDGDQTVDWEMNQSEMPIVISNRKCYHHYKIKILNLFPKIIPSLQDELSILYPLIHHYQQYPHFRKTTQLIIYWAYKKQLLNDLPLSALYILIISFFSTTGLPNIVHQFYQTHHEEVETAKRKYQIGQKMEPFVDEQLYEMNLAIRQMKGFYSLKNKKYMKAVQIYPIPYSLTSSQFTEPQASSPCQFFYRFIFFINQFIKKPKILKIDLKLKAGYSCVYSKAGFKLKVRHPVFHNELCDEMPDYLHTSLAKEVSKAINNHKNSQQVLDGLKMNFCN